MKANLIPEEQELADALISIVTKYGKLNADDTGIWAGYTPASENLELAKINVKCGSCVFFQGPGNCQVVEAEIEDGGLCRLATIPDGVVTAGVAPEEVLDMSKIKKGIAPVTLENDDIQGPCWDGYVQIGMKEKDGNQVPNCVPATASTMAEATTFAAENRAPAPDGFHYMPDGKLMPDSAHQDGAPRPEAPEGYHYMPDGTLMLDSAHSKEASITEDTDTIVAATAGSKPAPKKDQIEGSDKNKKGSASDGKSVNFTASITKALENKMQEHNEKAPNGRKVTTAKLKAVYRRGAGAFSTSHRPGQNRNSWAMARVNAFLHLVKSGTPKNSKYTSDNDLLPKLHPKSTTASAILSSLVASLNFEEPVENESDLDGPWLF